MACERLDDGHAIQLVRIRLDSIGFVSIGFNSAHLDSTRLNLSSSLLGSNVGLKSTLLAVLIFDLGRVARACDLRTKLSLVRINLRRVLLLYRMVTSLVRFGSVHLGSARLGFVLVLVLSRMLSNSAGRFNIRISNEAFE